MNQKAWALAPLTPFMVARLSWRVQDPKREELNMTAWAWRGWMFEPLADWTGTMQSLESLKVPIDGASLSMDWASDKQAIIDREASGEFMMFARQAKGLNGPWLPSEQLGKQPMSMPRICLIDIMVNLRESIPAQWDQAWHDRLSDLIVSGFGEQVEHKLSMLGLDLIECMGIHDDLSGEHYWGNVAERMAPGWLARKESRDIGRESKSTMLESSTPKRI
jgi:hypothetical protein